MAKKPEDGTKQMENVGDGLYDSEHVEYVGRLLTDDLIRQLDRVDLERAHVPLALAVLQRIRRLWHLLFGRQWFASRGWGDEEFYQRLRTGLLAQLDRKPEYDEVKQQALDVLPEMLPTSDELIALDDDIRAMYEANFQRLEARLIQLALSECVDPDTRNVAALLVTHDDYLRHMEIEVNKTYDRALRRYGLPPHEPRRAEPKSKSSGKGGRRAVELSYETAQYVWWEMYDEDLRKPTQQEFCDRLTAQGYPMSPRTLRVRIRTWRESGLTWEPPRLLE